ncbi:MAG: hypothetical protein ABII90_03580, partial [Bacteroidota bacterium]
MNTKIFINSLFITLIALFVFTVVNAQPLYPPDRYIKHKRQNHYIDQFTANKTNNKFLQQSSNDYISGQLFVKIKDKYSIDLKFTKSQGFSKSEDAKKINALIQKHSIQKIHKPFILNNPKLQRTYIVEFDKAYNADDLIKEFQQLEHIEYAEKVPLYKLFTTPDDLHPNQWHLPKIQAELAWDISTGSSDIVIGMVDDAVLLSHEDLASVIWINPGEIPGNGIDDDGNGYIDDINGWD